jgi:hypothetical protein
MASIGACQCAGRLADQLVVLPAGRDPHSGQPSIMGRVDEAREIIGCLQTIAPVMISDASYMRNPEHRELLLSGLRLAMEEAP